MFDILGYTEDLPAWSVLCLRTVAVLVECVKDVYNLLVKKPEGAISDGSIKGNLESGRGIGRETIHEKETALSLAYIRAAWN